MLLPRLTLTGAAVSARQLRLWARLRLLVPALGASHCTGRGLELHCTYTGSLSLGGSTCTVLHWDSPWLFVGLLLHHCTVSWLCDTVLSPLGFPPFKWLLPLVSPWIRAAAGGSCFSELELFLGCRSLLICIAISI